MIIIIQIVGLEPIVMTNYYHYVTATMPGSGPRSVRLSRGELTGPRTWPAIVASKVGGQRVLW